MEEGVSMVGSFLSIYGLKVIGAVIILVVGRFLAGLGRTFVRRALGKADVDASIISFLASLTYILILAFAVVAALGKFGVQTASIVAILGAGAFAVGLALQGSLSNFAAGVMILLFRPFSVGDVIDAAGVVGSVKAIHIFNTELSTPDNVKTIIPNSQIYGGIIKNITGYDTRRVDLVIGIGYGSSIQKAVEVLTDLMKKDDRIMTDPAPQIAVAELADSSVNLIVRPWVKKEDYWPVRLDLTRAIKEGFDENDIEIPFPQQVVYMHSEN